MYGVQESVGSLRCGEGNATCIVMQVFAGYGSDPCVYVPASERETADGTVGAVVVCDVVC